MTTGICTTLLLWVGIVDPGLSSASAFVPTKQIIRPSPPSPKEDYDNAGVWGLSLLTQQRYYTSREGSALHLSLEQTQPTFYLSRIVFIRALALVYSTAFTIAWHQNKALIGDTGMTPAKQVLDAADRRAQITRQKRKEWMQTSDPTRGALNINMLQQLVTKIETTINNLLWDRTDKIGRPVTTILWMAKDRSKLDPWLDGIAAVGLAASSAMLLTGAANVPLLLIPYICQRSLWAVGGPWYAYGWEPQLAELGFHALFMVPFLSLDRFVMAPPPLVLFTMRWMLFRIMIGAGLIKIKASDKKWRDFTAMNYFYETQPVPNPFSKYFHWAPMWWHGFEVATNHFVELVAPWLLLLPSLQCRRAGGFIQQCFQAVLISSGNLSFLNWLTAVPAILCLDDAIWGRLFPKSMNMKAVMADFTARNVGVPFMRKVVSWAFGLAIAGLSVPVVRNLCSRRQIMNGSFDPLRLVNTYGAFGVVEEVRKELIISSAMDLAGEWREYDFPVKPGDVMRPPRWISPYHFRLDWQLWIAACIGSIDNSPWIYALLQKLLEGDEKVMKLLIKDPWNGERPQYIRIEMFRYTFHRISKEETGPFPYWDRTFVARFYPKQGVASLQNLKGSM